MKILTLSVKQGLSLSPRIPFQCRPTVFCFSMSFHRHLGLGQRTESHCPVPFAAAPTTFRTYAATRSLAWNGCFMHTDQDKQSLESFARCTTNTTKLISYFGNVIIAGFFHVGKFSNVFAPTDFGNSYLYKYHHFNNLGFFHKKKSALIIDFINGYFYGYAIKYEKWLKNDLVYN